MNNVIETKFQFSCFRKEELASGILMARISHKRQHRRAVNI